MQQDIYPSYSDDKQIEHKVMMLLLVDKIDIPISNRQISQFAQEENYMNYFAVQRYLAELVDAGYLDKSTSGNTTRYTITDEGIKVIDTFANQVPPYIKARISQYVEGIRHVVKQDLEIVANHFFQHDNEEYLVKCAVYEDDNILMEINMSVVNKEQAVAVCNNWKNNVGKLYAQIIDILLTKAQ